MTISRVKGISEQKVNSLLFFYLNEKSNNIMKQRLISEQLR